MAGPDKIITKQRLNRNLLTTGPHKQNHKDSTNRDPSSVKTNPKQKKNTRRRRIVAEHT